MEPDEQRSIQLAGELRSWTRLVVAQVAADPPGASLSRVICTDLIRRAFSTVALQTENAHSGLPRLPPRSLELICEELSSSERFALSHVSSNLRAQLLSMPKLWATILSRNPHSVMNPPTPAFTTEMLQRSAQQRLAMSLSISEESVSRWLPVIAAHSDRMSSLDIGITWKLNLLETQGPSRYFWVATMEALHGPMPQLLHLRMTIAVVIYDDSYWFCLQPELSLSAALLAENSPLLRSCQFVGLTLDLAPAGDFRYMTCFEHSWDRGVGIDDIARILVQMPALRTLGITATNLDSTSWIGDVNGTIPHSSLRNLELRVPTVQCPSGLRPLLSIKSLRQLDLGLSYDTDAIVAAAFGGRNIARLVVAPRGVTVLTVLDDPGGSASTTIYASTSALGQYGVAIVCASTLTWLAIHELEYPAPYSELPVLPAVETLIVRLASCTEHYMVDGLGDVSFDSETSFATPTIARWYLPSLHYLCVSAPVPGRCAAPASQCVCTPPMSISLRDVAHFIRAGLRFNSTPMLDAVRLAGLRVIDPDFCAAWSELQMCTRTVDLVEEPVVIKHMDVPLNTEVDLEARFAARE